MVSALIVVRTCQFWSLATMLGGGGFLLLSPRVRGGFLLLQLASLVTAVSGAAWAVFTLVDVTGDVRGPFVWDDWQAFFGSSFGPPWAVRAALLVVCMAIVPIRRPMPYLVVGVALAVDQAWFAHAAAGTGLAGAAMFVSYWAHVLASFAWAGALLMLTMTLWEQDKNKIVAALALFSKIGILLVTTIFVSGLTNASFRLSAFGDLVFTPYGLLVGLKLVLFLAMVVLAAVNRHAIRSRTGDLGSLTLRIGAETCLGLAVLGIAALLGLTPPPG